MAQERRTKQLPSRVVLVNLGTPAQPSFLAVYRFLAQFLSDRRVVELPAVLWRPLLYSVILPLRCRRVARSYRHIWRADGSPILAILRRQCAALQELLREQGISVRYALSYGTPSIAQCLRESVAEGVERVLFLPLFPQYSATTTAPVYDQIARWVLRRRRFPDIRVVREYYDHPAYIAALADHTREYWRSAHRREELLLSFHGLPLRCVQRGDPYREQCLESARLMAQALDLAPHEWSVSFQSRFGPAAWLEPYTDEVLRARGARTDARVHVMCPGFAADCLETLEEISIAGQAQFLAAGGKTFHYMPCLNDTPRHILALRQIVQDHLFAPPQDPHSPAAPSVGERGSVPPNS